MAAIRILVSCALLAFPLWAPAKDLADVVPDLLGQTFNDVAYTPSVTLVFADGSSVIFNALSDPNASWQGSFSGGPALANVNSEIQGQVNRVPLGSTVSAFTFSFDTATNTFVRTTEGLGPLLSERGQTTGKGKLNVAFAYSFTKFKVFEGEDLDDLKVSYAGTAALQPTNGTGLVFATDEGGFNFAVADPSDGQDPTPVLSFGGNNTLAFQNGGSGSIDDLSDGQLFGGLASGTRDGKDISTFDSGFFTVPDPDTRLDLDLKVHTFALFATYGITDTIDVGVVIPFLDVHVDGKVKILDGFAPTQALSVPYTRSDSSSDFGIGDVIFRAKWGFLAADEGYVDHALRFDVVAPTGDEDNFRGLGHPSLGFLYVASKDLGRWSPHLNAGFDFRVSESHEHTFRWAVGADVWVLPRITFVVDFLGAQKLNPNDVGDLVLSAAGGIKWNVWRRLVIGANLLGRLNDQGLRANVVPSGIIEYTFF